MSDPSPSPQGLLEPSTSTASTVIVETVDEQDHEVPTLKLRLKKPRNDKKVQWTTETVDNEHMNKKKSKCCCIFHKPKNFDESSSEDESDEECEHCKGHVERKKKNLAPEGQSTTEDHSLVENHSSPDHPPPEDHLPSEDPLLTDS